METQRKTYLSPSETAAKFGRRDRTWTWRTSRTDPTFPRAYLINNRPHYADDELDAWAARKRVAPKLVAAE
jgi:hypothetical protein